MAFDLSQFAEYISGLWFQYRMGLDGDLPRIRQEIEAAIRDPLEERITKANEAKEAFRQLSLDLAREKTAIHEKWIHEVELRAAAEERIRELEADVQNAIYAEMEVLRRAGAEVKRLREALRKIVRRVEQPSAAKVPPLIAIEAIANGALATPSSTEGTKEVEG